MISLLLVVCLSTSGFAGPISPARAVSAIDWGTFTISYSGAGAVENDYFQTYAVSNGMPPVTDSVEAYSQSASAYGYGETMVNSINVPYQDVYADAGVDTTGQYGYGYADAGYFGDFRATNSGTLTISMDYYLKINVHPEGAGASARAEAGVYLGIGDRLINDILFFDGYDTLEYDEETPWRTLSLTFDMDAGDVVSFQGYSVAEAEASPVPVPGAVWLLGTGLFGLAGLQKRAA